MRPSAMCPQVALLGELVEVRDQSASTLAELQRLAHAWQTVLVLIDGAVDGSESLDPVALGDSATGEGLLQLLEFWRGDFVAPSPDGGGDAEDDRARLGRAEQ